MRTPRLCAWLTVSMPFLGMVSGAPAQVANPCAAITDDKSRLQCYDASAAKPAAAEKPPAPKEDSFIVAAKTRVKQQLRDPDSAQFQNVKIKTVGGAKGLCGEINAKNGAGGMTGFIPWAYDGKFAYILSFNAGAGNPTSFGADILDVSLGTRLEAHEKWCK